MFIELIMIFYLLTTGQNIPNQKPVQKVEGPKTIPNSMFEQDIDISEEECRTLAVLTLREARGESTLGKRLVIDTVLNRVDRDFYPNDILSVIYQPNQYTGVSEYGLGEEEIAETMQLVYEECEHRTNWNVLYFCNSGYNGPVPLFVEGHHWFSGQGEQYDGCPYGWHKLVKRNMEEDE